MCNFSINFNGSAEDLITRAQNAVTIAGGNLKGDTSAGNFSISTAVGKIVGTYRVNGQDFDIQVTDKPFFVSCSQIENQLRNYLSHT